MHPWEEKIGVTPNSWGVKNMKTKWGSFNAQVKRIWLNLEFAKKPLECLEYRLVHELIHLLERRHNERFKAYLIKSGLDRPKIRMVNYLLQKCTL